MADNDLMRSSLYVGDLHPEVTDNDLIDTFSQVAPVLSLRLCRDRVTLKSLCYAYVNFWLPCHAANALKCLNHTMLRGKPMRIMWYEKDPIARKGGVGNLFVKNLDKSITSAELENIFSKHGSILSCKVIEENGISKGFGFVQFDSEDSAEAALNALHDTELEGKKLYVSKFCKKIERKDSEQSFRSLIVRNLDTEITEDLLRDKFSEHGKVTRAVIMKDEKDKSKGFGFVNFDSHEAAKKAMEVLNGELIGSKNIIVARAGNKAEWRNKFGRSDAYNYGGRIVELNASNLFVSNLDACVDDKKLEELFSTYGQVISAKVIRKGGVSRGFGFVLFSCPDDASKALSSLNGTDFEGRTLYVAVAWSRDPQTTMLNNSHENFPPQPHYNSNYRRNFPHFNTPICFKQPSPWPSTSILQSVSNSLFPSQNFQGNFYPWPMQLANLNGYGQEMYLQKTPGRLQGKTIRGDGKQMCKGSATMGTFFLRSSPEIDKTRPGYMHLPLFQKFQPMQLATCNGYKQARNLEMSKAQNSPSKSQGMITKGDGKEFCKGSTGVVETFHIRSSSKIDKLWPGFMNYCQPQVQNFQTKFDNQGMLMSPQVLSRSTEKAVQS